MKQISFGFDTVEAHDYKQDAIDEYHKQRAQRIRRKIQYEDSIRINWYEAIMFNDYFNLWKGIIDKGRDDGNPDWILILGCPVDLRGYFFKFNTIEVH